MNCDILYKNNPTYHTMLLVLKSINTIRRRPVLTGSNVSASVCVWCVYASVQTYVEVNDQHGISPSLALCLKLLRQSLSLGLEPADSAGLDSRRAPGSTCAHLSPARGLGSHASTLIFNAGAKWQKLRFSGLRSEYCAGWAISLSPEFSISRVLFE